MDIKQLIEDYQRRRRTISIELTKGYDETTQNRLITKASCYRTFISELQQIENEPPLTGESVILHFLDMFQVECQLKFHEGTVPDAREWYSNNFKPKTII